MYVYLLSCTFKSMFIQFCDNDADISLVFIVQLLSRKSKINKNIGRKTEFRETNFRDGANFNNFRRV